jgi:hypothetical protein
MLNNTVVTAGDSNYVWGLFLLIASMRASGMDEPVIVGTKNFKPYHGAILENLGGVRLVSLDAFDQSLTCAKAKMMLMAETEYVTWADSDAFFTGNVSDIMPPPSPDRIHVRRRQPFEMALAFPPPYDLNVILQTWRHDVCDCALLDERSDPSVPRLGPKDFLSCSACFVSVARKQDYFLRAWDKMMRRLPKGDVGVVDRSLSCYHQLDESCLNACLSFLPNAPRVTDVYGMDKDRNRLFAHFCGSPKPWVAWTPNAFRFFDAGCHIVQWAQDQRLRLPGPVPFSLKPGHKAICKLLARPIELKTKVQNRLRRLCRSRGSRISSTI